MLLFESTTTFTLPVNLGLVLKRAYDTSGPFIFVTLS